MKIRHFMSVRKSILKSLIFPYDYKKYLITVKNNLSLTKKKFALKKNICYCKEYIITAQEYFSLKKIFVTK